MRTIQELEQKRDMYYHLYMSSGEKGFSSQKDIEEGYPSKFEFLQKFNSITTKIKAMKSRS